MAQSAAEVLDACFPEMRARLLDLAAALDRVDRSPGLHVLRGDPRILFIQDALAILQSTGPNRAEQVLNRYSV